MLWLHSDQVRDTEGFRCRCGYKTVADKIRCPRCGREMRPSEWEDRGRVLSFTFLNIVPEGMQDPQNLALVEVEDGPKLVCWTPGKLKVDDHVVISRKDGKNICSAGTQNV